MSARDGFELELERSRYRQRWRSWWTWLVVRGLVFAGLDVVAIHDPQTSFAAWVAFSFIHLGMITERR